MNFNLKKKTILVTGGTGILGKKICKCLAKWCRFNYFR